MVENWVRPAPCEGRHASRRGRAEARPNDGREGAFLFGRRSVVREGEEAGGSRVGRAVVARLDLGQGGRLGRHCAEETKTIQMRNKNNTN